MHEEPLASLLNKKLKDLTRFFFIIFILSDFDIIRILRNFARCSVVDFHAAFIILSRTKNRTKKI